MCDLKNNFATPIYITTETTATFLRQRYFNLKSYLAEALLKIIQVLMDQSNAKTIFNFKVPNLLGRLSVILFIEAEELNILKRKM